jgi:butyrate kinase
LEFAEKHNYDKKSMSQIINGRGGLYAWTGTSDALKIENELKERAENRFVLEAMAYQVAKEIAALGASLEGDVQAIVLTGGLTFSRMLNDLIIKRVGYLAPVLIFPGEKELEALAAGVLPVLNGEADPMEYRCPEV